ncbi:hypothetical protein AKJ18_25880, partial [Vibrio xuii]
MVIHSAITKELNNIPVIGKAVLFTLLALLNNSEKTEKPRSPNQSGVPVAKALFSCVVATIAIQTGSAI